MRRWSAGLVTGTALVLPVLLVALLAVVPAGQADAASSQPASASKPVSGNSQNNSKNVVPGTAKRGGVTISPAFQQVTLKSDQSNQTYDFSVTNNSSQEHEFALSVVDFGSLDETGGVLFVGNAEKALSYRYALSPWVTLEKDRVVVAPHATEKVPITLINKESLTPGGHYGAVLVTPTDTGDQAQKVQIDQVASSLLFVKKQGGEVYKLELNSLKVRPHIFSLPTSVDIRFQNAGNVHVIPRGLAMLTGPDGRVVKRGVINADSGIALPESFRSLKVPLQTLGSSWRPGRYTLTTTYRYDDIATVRTVKTSFVYLNIPFVVGVAALTAMVFALVLVPRLRRLIVKFCRQMYHQIRH
jgi:hypothetical protein